ncbi:ABC transporter permease subunit [Microcella daejeonensis]|uniref:ABC transporter permease subunit n=1 Tax=Microcella daejeonensis TaxID=2994971 RepID=A0A9E8MLB7_9MICO|nr:ABC transporter permease subunit [Microcella daejeonensis]WAB81584.1 ABC transporter permease subunit [Microcella daejeonensis]
MNLFLEAFAWLTDPANYQGTGSIPLRIGEHLYYTVIAVAAASLVAIPLGWLIGHTGRGREIAVGLSGAARALPSFGLLFLFVMIAGVQPSVRAASAILVLMLLAIPPILAGAYAGLEAIDRRTVDAARAMGMTEWQILWKVEVPLGLPLLFGGLRSGVLQVVATAVLAAFVNLGGLGYDIVQGIATRQYDQMLGSALLIIALALLLDAVFALLERNAVPRGVRAGRVADVRTASPRRRAAAESSATT